MNKDLLYKTIEVIERLVDNSEFEQYKEGYGKTIFAVMRGLMDGLLGLLPIIGSW